MNFSDLTKLQSKGLKFFAGGVIFRLICGEHYIGDIANMVMLYGLSYLAIDIWERRNELSKEEKENIELFQEFLSNDESLHDKPKDEVRAAFIAWRDSRHYSE